LIQDLEFFKTLLIETESKENIFLHRHLYKLYIGINKSKEAKKHLNIIIGLPFSRTPRSIEQLPPRNIQSIQRNDDPFIIF